MWRCRSADMGEHSLGLGEGKLCTALKKMFARRLVLFLCAVTASVILLFLSHLLVGGYTHVYPSLPLSIPTNVGVVKSVEEGANFETQASTISSTEASRSQESVSPQIRVVSKNRESPASGPLLITRPTLPQHSESSSVTKHKEMVTATYVSRTLQQSSSVGDGGIEIGADTSHVLPPSSAALFAIRQGFNLPHPTVFQPVQKVLEADWVNQLKHFLTSIYPARTVTLTVATKDFIPNLLNWLISAHLLVDPPPDNILVVAFDKEVYSLMTERKFPVIYVPYSSVMKGERHGVSCVWMTRLTIIRLMNHWGYDVQQFDTDAVLLQNPRSLFDAYPDYDLVSARGILPYELGRGSWGFTVCMGAALLRGTQKMEILWNVMHGRKMDKTADDQKRINFALHRTKQYWDSRERLWDQANMGSNEDGLKVAVLPPKYICRVSCTLNEGTKFFVWHQSGGGHSAAWKSKHNSKSHVWFLRSDFMKRVAPHDITGLEWLQFITQDGSINSVRQKLNHTSTAAI